MLLFLSLASIITSSNVTFEFNIDHNCSYAINVTFYTIKQESCNDRVLYSCKFMYNSSNCTFRSTLGSAEIPQNASLKFNPSVPRSQLVNTILYWYTDGACDINVSDVHISCDIDESSQTESTHCNKSNAATHGIKCARIYLNGIDDCSSCTIFEEAQGMCSVQSSNHNKECPLMATRSIISSIFMTSTSTTSSLMFASMFHDSSSTVMTLTTEYLSASATQYSSSAFVSSDMFSSSFPLISPTPLESSQPISASPSPTSLNCPLDPPWPQTLAGYNATNTCHKRLFNGQFDFIIFFIINILFFNSY